ncbi:MAG: S8 family peptidase [Epulopiscium sp.]|nr:S8 family peptidase [Candidatus Epulonipiscium sp.]
MIDSYVIEIPVHNLHKLRELKGIRRVQQDSHITAQTDIARQVIKANWAQERGYKGRSVGVVVLDSGIYPHEDFLYPRSRIIAFKDFVNGYNNPYDDNGHGTHVAGIIGGNGTKSNGKYVGIAPECNLIGIKILDEEGSGSTSNVLAGIQWMIDNKDRYNIRVANLSIGSPDKEGESDPMVRAVNAAWDAGIITLVAAGNDGPQRKSITSPGVSRKIITVGASDDQKTVNIFGDTVSNYSGRGPTKECIKKPDVVAPGSNIMACAADTKYIPKEGVSLKDSLEVAYVKKSGTSMATPMVSGALALLVENSPYMTPDDVKFYLKDCTNNLDFPQEQQGWGLIDIRKLFERGNSYGRKY